MSGLSSLQIEHQCAPKEKKDNLSLQRVGLGHRTAEVLASVEARRRPTLETHEVDIGLNPRANWAFPIPLKLVVQALDCHRPCALPVSGSASISMAVASASCSRRSSSERVRSAATAKSYVSVACASALPSFPAANSPRARQDRASIASGVSPL